MKKKAVLVVLVISTIFVGRLVHQMMNPTIEMCVKGVCKQIN